jgi:C4-dicarboxylate transporter DctQ subunit
MSEGHEAEPHQGKISLDLRLVTTLGAILMGATVTLTFLQVILRTFFNEPQAWAEEVSRYIFVWVVFVGAAIAAYRDNHIRLDLVDNLLRPRALWALKTARTLVEMFAAGLLLYSGILVAWRNRNSTFYTIPDLPQVVFYLSVPVCTVVIIWFLVRRLVGKNQSA